MSKSGCLSRFRLRHGFTPLVFAVMLVSGPVADESRIVSETALGTGFLYDPRFLEYSDKHLYWESPRRLKFIYDNLAQSGLLDSLVQLAPEGDALIHLRRVHSVKHIESIQKLEIAGPAAALAVSGVIAATKAVHEKKVRNAFCAVRPPGHHARNTGREEGFCYYANVAIAVRYALDVLGYRRILIIDWDYHHGNGTEKFFYDDPRVLFFSTHNKRAYPGTGSPSRQGTGRGKGFNVNVHLRCGSGNTEMLQVWKSVLLPRAEEFKPDFIFISAGFDSRKGDPLGCFAVTDEGFFVLTELVKQIAEAHAAGRIVSVLEGGYDLQGLATAVEAHIRALVEK